MVVYCYLNIKLKLNIMNYVLLMGAPCHPHIPACCATKPPNHPCHNNNSNVPLNEGIIILLVIGLIYGIKKIKK